MLKTSILTLAIAGIALSNTTSHFSKPVIISEKSIYIAENTIEATQIKVDTLDQLKYSIIGGIDKKKFSIDKENGELSFKEVPNFEKPEDFDQDNSYELIVMIKDKNGNQDKKNIKITILDVVEPWS